jgi:hypothetical protein
MDPATLAAAAVSFVAPYLLDFAKNLGSDAASEGSKSVWAWIKGKLTSDASKETIKDAEAAPKEAQNLQALQAALTKTLKADPDAAKALEALLKTSGAPLSSQSINFVGNGNVGGLASGQSTVTINVDRPASSRA